ncbi:hypothetical protein [Gordonia sp. NB41Y]|uniref:hypothetical protein n=1 Tax=Gordonia sp. NB41Y TaxID=875808 RepID=UPI0002BFA60E|nr:hypothetical protein [Gordonia sp. NB41Y]EMP14887.1 hypothetical protein ISGA_2029 [Gordonia sp. NB41Y]WLP89944.1 hypothetical protein Q9K23_20785 [Gordonia sp. NB41Y]
MSDHTSDDDRWKLLDPATRIDLTAVGLPCHELAESVDADGHREYWLILTVGLDVDGTDHGATQPPRHEGTKSLPHDLREHFAHQCGRPRTNGKPCQQIVSRRGDICPQHQRQTADR